MDVLVIALELMYKFYKEIFMLTKEDIIAEAKRLGFADIGFTDAQPFASQKEYLLAHQEEYGWTEAAGFSLLAGTDPKKILPNAKSIIVLSGILFRRSFSASNGTSFRPLLS